jgi:cell division protein FtsQ
MRQVRRLAYRTRHALRRPPPPRWRAPALYGLLVVTTLGLLGASIHIAKSTGLTERARFAAWDQLVATTDQLGLQVRDILSEGRQRTNSGEIYRILEPYYGQNILAVDIAAIQQRLQSLPWVREATVTRHFPDRLRTTLVEHRPIALWQPHVGQPTVGQPTPGQPASGPALVSDQGDIIQVSAVSPYRHLPILSGADAPAAAADLLRLIGGEPGLVRLVTGAERIDSRRWNVFIDGRIEVRLPERDAAQAWQRLARLHGEQSLLTRAVEAVDLRLADRVIVRLADDVLNPASGRPTASLRPGQRT